MHASSPGGLMKARPVDGYTVVHREIAGANSRNWFKLGESQKKSKGGEMRGYVGYR